MTTAKAGRHTVPRSTVNSVAQKLEALPNRKADLKNQKAAIEAMQSNIEIALNNGHSYVEIADILATNGIQISAATLKRQYTILQKP